MRDGNGRYLEVGDGHEIWIETYGDPAGAPAVFLHGGPGSGCNPSQRALFDPSRHFAVFVDQRGAGRSRPHGERRANTTQHLIADLERVREAVGIDRWLVAGGSWGATLALAYSEAHPGSVVGLVLRATFLGTAEELDWAFEICLRAFHPLHHQRLLALAPDGRDALWRRILDPDPAVHLAPARALAVAERAMSELVLPPDPPAESPPSASAFMEAHYFANHCFLEPGALLRDAGRLAGLPGVIVQARYDLLCPPATALRLAKAWPDARVVMVEAAGHSLAHPEVFAAVRAAIAELGG
jgi:proline iminopeptidase